MRMMRFITALGISCIILILASFIIPSCQATIEKEYEEYWYTEFWEGNEIKFFAFKVKVIIETETDGAWRNNTEYEVNLLVTLIYINREYVNYVVVNETRFDYGVEIVYGNPNRSSTLSYVGDSANYLFHVKRTYAYTKEYRFDLNPSFLFYGVKYEPPHPPATSLIRWDSPEPLYIDVTTTDFQTEIISYIDLLEAQLNIIRNLMYILVVTTIILIAITTYLAIKKTKV
jgi:hypothetical protein